MAMAGLSGAKMFFSDNNIYNIYISFNFKTRRLPRRSSACREENRHNWIKRLIDKQDISQKCRICGNADETVSHIVAECKLMAQKDYMISRHDTVAAIIHWELCKKYGFP